MMITQSKFEEYIVDLDEKDEKYEFLKNISFKVGNRE